jgi:DNA-binding transcriptional LysR family regulator
MMEVPMDLADLRVFEAVARLGGMNRAAAELNMVQSNVTARIRLLEDRLGVPLFERHSRGVSLTGSGQRLLPFAVEAQRLLENARRAVTDDGTPKGSLTIGALETTAALRLSPLLTRYASLYPAVDLVLRTGTSQEMIEAVLEHRLEGAFVCGPVRHRDLDETMIFREELVVVTAPTMTSLTGLATRSDLKLVVFRAGCSYRQRLEALLARRGLVGLRLLEFGTLDAIIGCIAAGIGLSLLPRAVVAPAAEAGRVRLHDLPAADARVETVFISRAGAYRSPALGAFLDLGSASASAELAA